MNPVDAQKKIIDQLYQIVMGSCPTGIKEASCRFDYQRFNDGSASVGQRFEYVSGGKTVSTALDRDLRRHVMDLVKQLHAIMKAHTGGDWNAFTLSIDKDGRVMTKFEYPETNNIS